MFRISVCFGDAGTVWAFMYRAKEAAEKARDAAQVLNASHFYINDDFGQAAGFLMADIKGVMIEDMDQSALAHQETMLHNARINARAQQRAQSDPGLKMAAMSPAIHSPFANGRPL